MWSDHGVFNLIHCWIYWFYFVFRQNRVANLGGAAFPCVCVVVGFLPECRVHWRCGMLWCECTVDCCFPSCLGVPPEILTGVMLCTISIVFIWCSSALLTYINKVEFYYFKIKCLLTATPLSLIPDSPYRTCELCSTEKCVFPPDTKTGWRCLYSTPLWGVWSFKSWKVCVRAIRW